MAQPAHARAVWVVLCLFALAPSIAMARGQEKTQYVGTLNREPAPSDAWSLQCRLTKLPKDARANLPEPLHAGDEAFGGTAIWFYNPPRTVSPDCRKAFRVVLIERRAQPPVVWVDGNGSGAMDAGERYTLSNFEGPKGRRLGTVAWRGPYAGRFRRYPLLLAYPAEQSPGDEGRTLLVSYDTVARALVDIAGRTTAVEIGVSSDDGGHIGLDREPHVFLGVDEDGDGTVDKSPGSVEFA